MPFDVLRRILDPLRGGIVTSAYPAAAPLLQPATRRLPVVDAARCERDGACAAACPTAAITLAPASWSIDAGRCVFCDACVDACPAGAIGSLTGIVPVARDPGGMVLTIELGVAPEGQA
jgi:formate hydrogenlyase subunit 6/NADH:ubiquinone oxidoreductase subunit I